MRFTENEAILHFSLVSSKQLLADRNLEVTDEQLQDAIRFIERSIGIAFQSEQFKAILCLYPKARIFLASIGMSDVGVIHTIKSALADFFTGGEWPGAVDDDLFISVLQKQAIAMNYKLGKRMY